MLDARVMIAATAGGVAIDRYYWTHCTLGWAVAGDRAASNWSDRLGRVIRLYWVVSILALGWMLSL